MKIKVLHVVGSSFNDGAYKGANILHKALLDSNIDSKLLNDSPPLNNPNDTENHDETIIYINNSFFKKLINNIYIILEKVLKSIYLPNPRSTFTLWY